MRKDFKGREMIVPFTWYYNVDEDGVQIERSWKDLEVFFTKKTLNNFLAQYNRTQLKEIFKSLHSLMRRKPDFTEQDKEQAINRAIKKANREVVQKLNYIFITDETYCLYKDNNTVYNSNKFLQFIEQLVHGNIVIVSDEIENMKWFKSLDLSDTEVLYYDKYSLNPRNLFKRKEGDLREIFVLGGKEAFKNLYEYATDFWVAYVDNFTLDADIYFTELPLYNLQLEDCFPIKDAELNYKITHLYLPKGKTKLKWKENKYEYNRKKQDR